MTAVEVAAVDLGATSGRVMLGRVGRDELSLTPIARFPNGPVTRPDGHSPVAEAVQLLQVEGARTDPAGHDPAAGGAEVDRGDADGFRRTEHHRRKAAATPASTGMCRPVVWLSSEEQSTKTALAMFSGSTSRLRIVRCA